MANQYTSKHVSTLYDVAIETVRVWSQEFERHLSPTANPGKRRQRLFTPEDMKVFDLLSEMKGQGKTFADIHTALDSGQRGGTPETPPDELEALIVSQDERSFAIENERLQQTIVRLQKEIEALKELEKETVRLETKLESETERAARAEQQTQKLLEERGRLREQIGELRGEIKAIQRHVKQSNPP